MHKINNGEFRHRGWSVLPLPGGSYLVSPPPGSYWPHDPGGKEADICVVKGLRTALLLIDLSAEQLDRPRSN